MALLALLLVVVALTCSLIIPHAIISSRHSFPPFFVACGVCSNAHDLSIMMDPRSLYEWNRLRCGALHAPNDVAYSSIWDGETFRCFKAMGLTDQCAYIHASNAIASSDDCSDLCLAVVNDPDRVGNTYGTCQGNICVQCNRIFQADGIYHKWAGRDLQNSGLVGYNQHYHVKYPCAEYESNRIIKQDPYEKARKVASNGTLLVARDASPLLPSYQLLLHQEMCLYELRLNFKHDPTFPLAGGWNTELTNGVNPREYARRCSRSSPVQADDGKMYREPRTFTFKMGRDVKNITGIFDHASFEFNPCGHGDDELFGRTNYKVALYSITPDQRMIMDCDSTPCDPQICIYDEHFQSSESGKKFFEMDTCYEASPGERADMKLSMSGRNMPAGFSVVADTGNPHAGIQSYNTAATANWNITQWTDPLLSIRSYRNLITAYEIMVPTEFVQGIRSKSFANQESQPMCHTSMGIPLTFSVEYDQQNRFTTFSFIGNSANCRCDNDHLAFSPEECSANDAELKLYEEVFGPVPEPNPKSYFGPFSTEEMETAFELSSGSLITPAQEEKFECLSSNNIWTNFVGIPLVIERLILNSETPRNRLHLYISRSARLLINHEGDKYHEHALLGCFYRPKDNETIQTLVENDAQICTDEPTAWTGKTFTYQVAAYIDEYTRLVYLGYDADFIQEAQFQTQFFLQRVLPNYRLVDNEIIAYELIGPNRGAYSGFRDPPVPNFDFLGNIGRYVVTLSRANLEQPCPDLFCAYIIPGFVPNPAGPNASWPEKIIDNQCNWFPCSGLANCPPQECPKFTPGTCADLVSSPQPPPPPPVAIPEPSPSVQVPTPTSAADGWTTSYVHFWVRLFVAIIA